MTNSIQIWEDPQTLKEIKNIYAPGATDNEFKTFVGVGMATKSNPFLKEIWFIKYGNKAASIFLARDRYRSLATAQKNYDYHQPESVYENDDFKVESGEIKHSYDLSDRGKLLGAYCKLQKKGASKPIYVYVKLSEYNKNQSTWKDIPDTMIKKVAEAQCLRMAYPDIFQGTYSEDEAHMVDEAEPSTVKMVQEEYGKEAQGFEAEINEIDSVDLLRSFFADRPKTKDLNNLEKRTLKQKLKQRFDQISNSKNNAKNEKPSSNQEVVEAPEKIFEDIGAEVVA